MKWPKPALRPEAAIFSVIFPCRLKVCNTFCHNSPKHASICPSEWPAQNISDLISTLICLLSCQRMQSMVAREAGED